MPISYITRTLTFCSGHRLHSPHLSDKENFEIFGKCNSPNGHVQVTIKGHIDPVTGMVMNLNELREYMEVAIHDQLDHKNIDKDVAYFKENTSTAENVAVFIWKEMIKVLPKDRDYELYEVTLQETGNNTVTYKGE
ncbi:hypothetical protein HDV01_002137 [Terramyces sp. JEL0728]|nr:hypothetical protein HDV01_002137 [Terramyces sp. JEL0728]